MSKEYLTENSFDVASLTKKEKQVLDSLLDLVEPSNLPDHLHISPNTVETHLRNIRLKLGVKTTVQAVCVYIKSRE